jgi:signal transduction histidine kinase
MGIPTHYRFLLGVLLVVGLALLVFNLLLPAPVSDLALMALFLSVTALISALVAYAAYRMGWIERSPALRWTLLGSYGLASALTFLNIWLTARLMFASAHDLALATVLLFFASGIAIVLGYFLSAAITERIASLAQAAQRLAQGELTARTEIRGRDELALLGRQFNQMAQQLQQADQRQRELDTMRRDLIAWVSHDLQTPLASVRAMVEALADGVVDDPEMTRRYLRTAQRDIGALSRLIDDLFQVAQIDAGGLALECEWNALSDLISDTLESFGELAKQEGVSLKGCAEAGVDPLWMDAQRIGRVLNNLVNNALRHTPPGGEVQVCAYREAHQVRVEVSDTGEGIAPEDLPLIFERFYRSEKSRSRSTGGAGLGLAIARGVVEAHGGQISVASTPGQGTVFTFRLPARG